MPVIARLAHPGHPPPGIASTAVTGAGADAAMPADAGDFSVERHEPDSPTVLGFNPPALRPA
jgi:hypothetical protein